MFTNSDRVVGLLQQRFPSASFYFAQKGAPFELICLDADMVLRALIVARSRQNLSLNRFISDYRSEMLLNEDKLEVTKAIAEETKTQVVAAFYLQEDDVLLVQKITNELGKLQTKTTKGKKHGNEESIHVKVQEDEINRAIETTRRKASARSYTNTGRAPDPFNPTDMARLGEW